MEYTDGKHNIPKHQQHPFWIAEVNFLYHETKQVVAWHLYSFVFFCFVFFFEYVCLGILTMCYCILTGRR